MAGSTTNYGFPKDPGLSVRVWRALDTLDAKLKLLEQGESGSTTGISATTLGAVAASRYAGGTTTGAPVAGAHLAGDFVIAQDGAVWVCTASATPGTWVLAAGAPAAAITTLQTEVETGGTGLLDRTGALETTIDTAVTGLVAKVGDLETTVDTAGTGLNARVGDLETNLASASAVTGHRDSPEAALKNLLTVLDAAGIIDDQTDASA